MKVAISIPDDVFDEAEQVAAQLGKSRSRLYADALTAFLDSNRDQRITEQLNAVYANVDSRVDPAWKKAQLAVLGDEAW